MTTLHQLQREWDNEGAALTVRRFRIPPRQSAPRQSAPRVSPANLPAPADWRTSLIAPPCLLLILITATVFAAVLP